MIKDHFQEIAIFVDFGIQLAFESGILISIQYSFFLLNGQQCLHQIPHINTIDSMPVV